MYAAISGIYENGQVILQEPAPTSNRMKVLIVFVEELNQSSENKAVPTQNFSKRWQGQFEIKGTVEDAKLDYLKQRYQL